LAAPRLLLVKLSSLGDVIHTLPVVQDILAAHPQAVIDWVVEPGFAPLLRRVDGLRRVIECAQRRWRARGLAGLLAADVRAEKRAFLQALREETYDTVIDLQGLTKSALVARRARLAQGGERVALANRTDGSGYEPPTRWVAHRVIRIPPRTPALDRSRQLAAAALGYALQGPPRFGLQGRLPRHGQRTGVFVHGTSRADKLWPEADWVALGRRLVAEGWRIALPQGSDDEAARAARLAAGIGADHCDAWPRMGLDALVDEMGACHGVIGVDSGLSHLAVALELPHVQLYNFPTAWRTGPQPVDALGEVHGHQVSVVAQTMAAGGVGLAPSLDDVWAAWQGVCAATERARP
jgi:heptosyltransferase-1